MKRNIWSPIYFFLFTGLLGATHFVHSHWRQWKHGPLQVCLVGTPETMQKNLKIYLAQETPGKRQLSADTAWMSKHPDQIRLIFDKGKWYEMPEGFEGDKMIVQCGKWTRLFEIQQNHEPCTTTLVEIAVNDFGGIPHLAFQLYCNEKFYFSQNFEPFSNQNWNFYYH